MDKHKKGRREFLLRAGAAGVSAMVIPSWACAEGKKIMTAPMPAEEVPWEQRPLPYTYSSLEPVIDAMTMEIHYSKHASAYAKNLADAVKGESVDTKSVSLAGLLGNISKYSAKMRNNGGGHYNHEFFWRSMKGSREGNQPGAALMSAVTKDFGSFDALKTQFSDAAKNRFGSGWAWLVKTADKKMVIGSSPNQDNPLMDISDLKGTPLLGLDVWEHAYYLKYQNRRADYVNGWWSLVNWDIVQQRFETA